MPTISGQLKLVTDKPARVTELWVRPSTTRAYGDGSLLDFRDVVPVNNGRVEFTCVPGPAAIMAVSPDEEHEPIPILVEETPARQTLYQVIKNAETVEGRTADELAAIVSAIKDTLKGADSVALQVDGYRRAAEQSAGVAAGAASDAKAARDEAVTASGTAAVSATSALGHANAAKERMEAAEKSAGKAAGHESTTSDLLAETKKQAKAAAGSATEAGESASTATDKAKEALDAYRDAVTAREGAEKAQREAETARDTTLDYRDEAKGFRDEAEEFRDDAGTFAGTAETKAGEAEKSADTAATHATTTGKHVEATTAAVQRAGQEADRATSEADRAKGEADRAEGIAQDTYFDGTVLVVNGVRSPDLKGEQGDKGDTGSTKFSDLTPEEKAEITGVKTWGELSGKPEVFPPAEHRHDADTVDVTTGELAGTDVADALETLATGKADTGHTHAVEDVTGLDEALKNAQVNWDNLDKKPNRFPAEAHGHQGVDVQVLMRGDKTRVVNAQDVLNDHQETLDGLAERLDNLPAPTWKNLTGKPATFPPSSHSHDLLDKATDRPTPGTLVKRYTDGTFEVKASTRPNDAVNNTQLDAKLKNHTHTSADLTDASNDVGAGKGGKVVKGRDGDGKIFTYTPVGEVSDPRELVPKAYVDYAVAVVRETLLARPALFSGKGTANGKTIPGARVGDYYLNEDSMELERITGV